MIKIAIGFSLAFVSYIVGQVIPGLDDVSTHSANVVLIGSLFYAVRALWTERQKDRERRETRENEFRQEREKTRQLMEERTNEFMKVVVDYKDNEVNQTRAFDELTGKIEKQIEVEEKQTEVLKNLEQKM